MLQWKPRAREQWFVFGIILLAILLRSWRFWDFDYVHDELSALTRMNYSSWKDFYHFGIEVDGHPAGVHLFLKFLYTIVGDFPFFIRLPFLVFSILSVYQVYKIGKEWFSESTGLISATFLSVIQYAIYQGVLARPYSPGLLVSLLLLRVWTNLFITKKKSDWKSFLLYGLLLSLTGYIHYFALLFGIVLSLVGLFWINKKQLWKFIGAGCLAILLYIPHITTFLYQLNIGGLTWLNKPDSSFFTDFIMYSFNHSYWFLGSVFFGTIYFSYSSFVKFNPIEFKKRTTLLLLFFIPLLTGYFYSIFISPVLQYSVLIFGFPCFILFIFSFWKKKQKYILPIVGIAILGVASLVFKRDHLNWFSFHPTEKFFELCSDEGALNIGRHEKEFSEFYMERFESKFDYHTLDRDCTTIMELQTLLQTSTKEKVVLGDVFQKEVGLIHQYYPNVLYADQGNGYEHFIFSKGKEKIKELYYLKEDLLSKLKLNSSDQLHSIYSLNIELNYDSLIRKSHDIVDVFIELELDSFGNNNIILVTELTKAERSLKWLGANSEKQMPVDKKRVYLLNSYSIPWDLDSLSGLQLKAYVWNPEKKPFKVHKYGIGVREGNKNRFSAFKKLRY